MKLARRSILIRTVLLSLPVFLIWHLLVVKAVLPVVTGTTDFAIKSIFSNVKPRLFFQERTQLWELETALFRSDIAYDNNTYKPGFSVTGATILEIGKLEVFTLGLPLFWLLLMVSATHKLKHFFKGSIILAGLICLNLILLVSHKLIGYLKSSALIRVYDSPYILKPPATSMWYIDAIKPLLDTLVYLNILVIPVFLVCYYYQSQRDTDSSDKSQ